MDDKSDLPLFAQRAPAVPAPPKPKPKRRARAGQVRASGGGARIYVFPLHRNRRLVADLVRRFKAIRDVAENGERCLEVFDARHLAPLRRLLTSIGLAETAIDRELWRLEEAMSVVLDAERDGTWNNGGHAA